MNVQRLDRHPQIEFLVDDFAAEPFRTRDGEALRPTNANVVFGPGGDFRYAQVWGWRIEGGNEFAGRRCVEASATSLKSAEPFVQRLVEEMQP
ncbi:hypothetical protein AB0F72_08620 [Actinoplanes sp. NPDC023936]|uniref:hypothetical protein n=1 Tax=Actinoplanes sp. NPDC023936 TaxID=3154910 RepID=UPI0033E23F3A